MLNENIKTSNFMAVFFNVFKKSDRITYHEI